MANPISDLLKRVRRDLYGRKSDEEARRRLADQHAENLGRMAGRRLAQERPDLAALPAREDVQPGWDAGWEKGRREGTEGQAGGKAVRRTKPTEAAVPRSRLRGREVEELYGPEAAETSKQGRNWRKQDAQQAAPVTGKKSEKPAPRPPRRTPLRPARVLPHPRSGPTETMKVRDDREKQEAQKGMEEGRKPPRKPTPRPVPPVPGGRISGREATQRWGARVAETIKESHDEAKKEAQHGRGSTIVDVGPAE